MIKTSIRDLQSILARVQQWDDMPHTFPGDSQSYIHFPVFEPTRAEPFDRHPRPLFEAQTLVFERVGGNKIRCPQLGLELTIT